MKTLFLLFPILFVLASCCKEPKRSISNRFNATINAPDVDCNTKYIIDFDTTVQGLPHGRRQFQYREINLPDAHKVLGKRVRIEFRAPYDNEQFACTFQGQGYPLIYILNVYDYED